VELRLSHQISDDLTERQSRLDGPNGILLLLYLMIGIMDETKIRRIATCEEDARSDDTDLANGV